jgi:hypothetical protein
MRSTAAVRACVLFGCLAGVCHAGGAPPHVGLCVAGETAYFSCAASRARSISVCGASPSTLQYRFGRPQAIELRFPASPAEGPKRIHFAHYGRYQTDRIELRFENAGAEYVVFDYQESGKRLGGVRVTTTDGKQRELSCTGPITSRLAELKEALPCDRSSALNGGSCP